jgi:hypothetical protein
LSNRWNPWPVSIIGFFVVAIAGLAAFIAYCNFHRVDLVSPGYYEEELRYQDEMDRLRRAQQFDRPGSVSLDADRKVITILLPPEHAKTPCAGSIRLYRPSDSRLDRNLPLEADRNGIQTVDASALAPGLWKVRVAWQAAGQDYLMIGKVIVPASRP